MSFIQFNFESPIQITQIEEFDFYVKKLLIINPIGFQKKQNKKKQGSWSKQ